VLLIRNVNPDPPTHTFNRVWLKNPGKSQGPKFLETGLPKAEIDHPANGKDP